MWQLNIVLFILTCHGCYSKYIGKHGVRKFPDNFLFGTASSAYQVEGAWNEDGKSENIWDALVHSNPSPIIDNSTGDVASNSYHLYKRDVEMMRELGLQFYRFSLSWARILPTSFPDKINQAGVDYYNNLINEMLKYNIQPMITLYHWDLPKKLQDMGGWTNPYIVKWFADYAKVAFELFGDRVKYWITINESHVICYYGHAIEWMAPRFNHSGVADYMCAKNVLLAHAEAYHIYDKQFRPRQGGTIFIAISAQWYEPESHKHAKAAEDHYQFSVGLYTHPIFSKAGGWPPVVSRTVATKSAKQGFFRSRLPSFTRQQINYIKGTSDIFGLNHYTSHYVYRNASSMNKYPVPSSQDDLGVIDYQLPEWRTDKKGDMIGTVPWGFYKLLMKIKEDYDNPTVFITENGFATPPGLNDEDRVFYYVNYLDAMLDAMDEGANVRAYTAWSLLDNFEWIQGYVSRFGLYEVDFDDEQRPRTPRKSAFVYKEIVRTRTLNPSYEPDTTTMTIDEGH